MKKSRDSSEGIESPAPAIGKTGKTGMSMSELESLVLEQTPFPVLRFSSDGTLKLANAAAAPLLDTWKLAPGSRIGEPWRRRIQISARSGRQRDYETDVGLFTFKITLLPNDDGGAITLAAHDVTVDRAVRDMLDEDRTTRAGISRMIALGEMAAGMAHEINNPLAIIQAYTEELHELAQKGAVSAAEALRIAERVSDTSMRIAKLVGSMLQFSRDPHGEHTELASLRSIIDMATTFCGHRLSRNGVKLELCLSGNDLQIECFPVQISQVLVNLINNSFDAVIGLKEKWIRVEAHAGDEFVMIRVVDSGQISKDIDQAKLFTPYYTTKPRGQGTGLGLPLSRNTLLAHHGELSFDPTAAHTTFVIRLPLRQPKPRG